MPQITQFCKYITLDSIVFYWSQVWKQLFTVVALKKNNITNTLQKLNNTQINVSTKNKASVQNNSQNYAEAGISKVYKPYGHYLYYFQSR